MKKLIFFIFFISISTITCAQTDSNKITIKQGLSVKFYQNGKKLKPIQLLKITRDNAEAYKEMKKAKANLDVSNVLAIPGGLLFGFPLGQAMAGGEPNKILLGVGAGLIIASIPLSSAYTKRAKKAVNIYNAGNQHSEYRKFNVNMGFAHNGVGLQITF